MLRIVNKTNIDTKLLKEAVNFVVWNTSPLFHLYNDKKPCIVHFLKGPRVYYFDVYERFRRRDTTSKEIQFQVGSTSSRPTIYILEDWFQKNKESSLGEMCQSIAHELAEFSKINHSEMIRLDNIDKSKGRLAFENKYYWIKFTKKRNKTWENL